MRKLEKYDYFTLLAGLAIFITIGFSKPTPTQAAAEPTLPVESYDLPEEVEHISKSIAAQASLRKFPVHVQYTGEGGGEIPDTTLKTWVITDKATGARVLVVQDAGSDQVTCSPLPPLPR